MHPGGLNRTSVGLKQLVHQGLDVLQGLPQSNQRGIETQELDPGLGNESRPQSNQRGIETWNAAAAGAAVGLPQSNQRGIETQPGEAVRLPIPRASIEPAWD